MDTKTSAISNTKPKKTPKHIAQNQIDQPLLSYEIQKMKKIFHTSKRTNSYLLKTFEDNFSRRFQLPRWILEENIIQEALGVECQGHTNRQGGHPSQGVKT